MAQRLVIATDLSDAMRLAGLAKLPSQPMQLEPLAVPRKAGKKSRRLRKNAWVPKV